MAAIDDFYKALVDKFGTVEITPQLVMSLDFSVWEGAREFLLDRINYVPPAGYLLREEPGYEIRPRPLVMLVLDKAGDRYRCRFEARLEGAVVPETQTTD